MTHLAHHATIAALLDQEWETLRHRRRAVATVRSWAATVASPLNAHFADLTDLNQLLVGTQREAGPAGNDLLAALLGLAQHQQLAGRIVVQRLLPGVITASRRYRFLCDHGDPVAEAIGALWLAIDGYDIERRTGPVAASLISDATFSAFRRRTRLLSFHEEPTEPHTFDVLATSDEPPALLELSDVIAEARRTGVRTYDLDLLRHLVRAGSPTAVAQERRITTRTVRNHRTRAIARVQRALSAA